MHVQNKLYTFPILKDLFIRTNRCKQFLFSKLPKNYFSWLSSVSIYISIYSYIKWKLDSIKWKVYMTFRFMSWQFFSIIFHKYIFEIYIYIYQFNLYHVSSCHHHCISLHETSTVIFFFRCHTSNLQVTREQIEKKGEEDVHHARQVKRLCMMTILKHFSSFHSVTINSSLVTSYFTHFNSIRSFMPKWQKTPVTILVHGTTNFISVCFNMPISVFIIYP
jgi:hypothetical protein